MTNPFLGLCASALVLPLLACSASVGAGDKKGDAGHGPRDTTIHHEPCDGDSSSARKVDVNGDGRPDIVHVMEGAREVCRIVDLNFDGAVDVFIYYDEQGRERRRESDFDRDGRPDEIAIYEGGALVRKERETNFDNRLDTWDHYEGGRIVRRERDSSGDGFVDQWWQFNDPANPKCAIVAMDTNGDNKPDPDSVVDLCAEAGKSTVAAPPAPPPAEPDERPAATGADPEREGGGDGPSRSNP